jgi:hypothetical protein
MTRTVRTILGGVLACLLLAGCTGTDPATPGTGSTPEAAPSAEASSPAPSESPSPSPTPTVEPPERPAAMDDDGIEGAKAAAEYFIQLDPYIMKSNDTEIFETMSHRMCEWCSNRLEQAAEIAANEHVFEGGEVAVRVDEVYQQDPTTSIWPVRLYLTIASIRVADRDGATVFEDDGSSGGQVVEVVRDNSGWRVVGVVKGDDA